MNAPLSDEVNEFDKYFVLSAESVLTEPMDAINSYSQTVEVKPMVHYVIK